MRLSDIKGKEPREKRLGPVKQDPPVSQVSGMRKPKNMR